MTKGFVRAGTTLLIAVLSTGALAGCGGSSADQQRLDQEKLEAARQDGARQARMEAQAKQAEQDTADLKKQIADLKKDKDKSSSSSSSRTTTREVAASAPAASSSVSGTSCGSGTYVNSVTTCPFAENVRSEFYDEDEDSTISVFSPVTDRSYSIYCTQGSPHVCTGGNSARVTFP